MSRDYSLCGDPADRRLLSVAVQRDRASRGGSAYVHDRLRVGEIIKVDGPDNDFPLEPAGAYVLVAGGIGVTPIKAMAEELHRRAAPWHLLYCGRSRASMAFLDVLEAFGPAHVTVHADDERGGPPDIAALLPALAPAPPAAPGGPPYGGAGGEPLVYCCGPEPLIQAVTASLADVSRLRVERFRAPESAGPAAGGEAFDVVCATSGVRVSVPPGRTILEIVREAGVPALSSCEEGVCGTCETRVIEGTPEHRDFLLTDEERAAGEVMMICCSRSRDPELVLDL
ncbi:oxidoreductase [Bailinhaonella thermotolerans]|uniref:Oxidoreductase n=2 Tax=Bailinhaonella thermotolerans TaxID=1070861 RepID=A0A3A4AFY6_9ACTN|nr:oxidoreductase [Bailinhaonella thermotolerans]